MKKYFNVSFQYSESVYCANIAHAETAEDVAAHYSKHEWVKITEAQEYEVESAQRKGMPVVECDHIGTAEQTGEAFTISRNERFGSLEVTFEEKPTAAVREALKGLRFRWNGKRGVWYGFADETAVRAAICGERAEQKTEQKTGEKSGTPQEHLRIYWNGIKIDGGSLIKCSYSLDNNVNHAESVTIYARSYGDSLPRDLFEVRNDTDLYTDYFDKDSATLTPSHPLYKYFRYAAEKAKARDDVKYCERLRAELNSGRREPWAGHYETLRQDLARREAFIAEFAKHTDPKQPTAEDLAAIDAARQEAENARREAEHQKELAEREAHMNQRANGRRLIDAETEAHPIADGEPFVVIEWSEHPAFDRYGDGELRLSVTAAENILRTLDEEQNRIRETPTGCGWYYKTSFTVHYADPITGEESTYTGRYDLGDGDGGLIEHIRAFGRWYRTHNPHTGAEIAEPVEDLSEPERLAEYLSTVYTGKEYGAA